ncbi:hypothetical protein Poli38472_002615 [Pythium oligandrum]|uniref:Multidrug and toxic compound extrusion protein n=1 Tax=Pythium oligandrum TaxID=41045 RepID=A0A8K1FJZ9_PYTOL|nr:hypothetical protein Poli38472_002615 [Pythium oligandrum]|eukprot:TMW63674.1 hypothetical protein Poli38472_002615 [Pythium oligandrum]
METPLLTHDALLLTVEGPQQEQLRGFVEGLRHGAKVVFDEENVERTPLLMAGTHIVTADSSVGLKTLATKLSDEEQEAVWLDAQTSATQIIREETKRIFDLSQFIILIVLLDQLPDTFLMAMIGRIDKEHSTYILAAYGLATGAKRFSEFWMYVQAGVLMHAACLPFLALILLNSAAISRGMDQDPAIAKTASTLLLITLGSTPLTMIYLIQKSALQAQGMTGPVALSSILSWVVSLPAAYLLGFHTSLSYLGISLSGLINSAVQGLVLFVAIMRHPSFRETWPGWKVKEAARLLRKLVRLGVSNMLVVTLQMLGLMVVTVLLGTLPNPATAIAVNSIFMSVVALSWTPMISLCTAGAIRMGNALGAGKARRAELTSRITLAMCVFTSTVAMVVVVSTADRVTRIFTTNAETIRSTVTLFHQGAIVVLVVGCMFGLQAIFSACGEQWLCARLNCVFLIMVAAPLGVYLATKWDLDIAGLWYGNCVGALGIIVCGVVWPRRQSWEEMAHKARLNTHLHVEENPPAVAAWCRIFRRQLISHSFALLPTIIPQAIRRAIVALCKGI